MYLGVDTLPLLEILVDPEECGREHETRLPVSSSLLNHLHASGSSAVDCIVPRAHQEDLHTSQ